MGCGSMTPVQPMNAMNVPTPSFQQQANLHQFNNNVFNQVKPVKKPNFLSQTQLPHQIKQMIWNIITKDSLRQFAFILQSKNIPNNIQIGPSGNFWNIAHFCIRWDAFRCLQYIIKKTFAEKSTLFMAMMNQQTIQGYTPIHLSIIWNAINCFYVLLDSGNIDLTYKDRSNNDVFSLAMNYKRQQMLAILQKFKYTNNLMILSQTQNLRGYNQYHQQILLGNNVQIKQYKLNNQKIDYIIDTKNRLNKPPPPPPTVPNYDDFFNAMRGINAGKLITENNININTQNNSKRQQQRNEQTYINQQKIIEQKKFQQAQKLIKQKQQQQKQKYLQQLKKQQQKRLQAQRIAMQIKLKQQKQLQQAQLKKIQQQKLILLKNIENMNTAPNIQNNIIQKKNNLICPPDIKQIYDQALNKGVKFVDSQFPAQQKSIGDPKQFKFGWANCIWLRPQQIFPQGKYELFDGISSQDIKQGTLGVCYYLALLSSMAQFQNRIKKLFKFFDKQLGFYAIQLYLEGVPKTIIVDDQFPCMAGTKQPLFAKPNGKQIWVMVLQKAWVKMFGTYLSAESMAPVQMFENVMPAPVTGQSIDISEIQSTFDKLVQYNNKKYIMTSSTTRSSQNLPQGLVQKHAYSLLDVYNFNGVRLSKVRNPWGKTEFNGYWGQKSPNWTPQLKSKVGYKQGNDGIFFLSPTQQHELMCYYAVSMYKDDYQYSYKQFKSKSNQDVYFVVNIKKAGEVCFKVIQQNQRFRKKMEFQNAPILFQIAKIQDNYLGKFQYFGQPSCAHGGLSSLYASQNIFQKYQPGRYLVRIKVFYNIAHPVTSRGTMRRFIKASNGVDVLNIRQQTSTFCIYGPQSYAITSMQKSQAQKYMKNIFKQYILRNPKSQVIHESTMAWPGGKMQVTLQAKSCFTRSQIIYYAENKMPRQTNTNCHMNYNIDKKTGKAKFLLAANGGWDLCTLQIDQTNQQRAGGQLEIQTKIIR